MNTKHATTAIAAALLFTGFISPAAAQPVQVNSNAEAQASASANPFGSVMKQLQSVQERLDTIQQRVPGMEARSNGNADARVAGERPEAGNGAEVNHSVEVENGTKTVSHSVEKNGETIVSFVKEVVAGEDDRNRNEAELELTVDGNVSEDANVTVSVTLDSEPVANATVKVNGEEVGKTDSEGKITFQVPEDEELEIEAEKGESEGELELELESSEEDEETEEEETEEDSDENQEAEAEANVSAEAALE